MTERLTASRLELAANCPGAFALPHVDRVTEASRRGTVIHEFIAGLLMDEPVGLELAAMDIAAREVCEPLSRECLEEIACAADPASELHVEIAFAYDTRTCASRLVPQDGHRDYSEAPEDAICGTADAVAVHEDHVTVTDWKTGSYPVADPAENYQLRFLGLAAARAFRRGRAVVQIAQIREDGSVSVRHADLGLLDLGEFATDLRVLLGHAKSARPDLGPFRVGSHCRFCPAFAHCPAQAGAATAMLEEKSYVFDPQAMADAWERLQAVEAAARRVRAVLEEYVRREESIPLPGGREVRLVKSRRDYIDSEIALPVLREYVSAEHLDRALSISKSALVEAVGKEHAAELLAEIAGAGGIERRESKSLREVGA